MGRMNPWTRTKSERRMGSGEQPKLQRVMLERARERESARESRASVEMIIKDTYLKD